MATKDDDDYRFSRGYQDSARLVLQHWLWLYRLKYVLNPSIPAKDENLKIADVGTGNAVWLMELLPHIPASTQLDGFDISADHYPAKEWLPHNVTLDLFDAFGDAPEHLVGRYDIVHIRTFAVIVRNNDPGPLLRNLIRMLKPGGYLQWDEMDLTTFLPGVVNLSASKAAADEFMTKWMVDMSARNLELYTIDWIPNLKPIFRENGLSDVAATTFPPIHEQRKAFTDNALMGLEESCAMFTAREKTSELGTKSQWWELFEKMVTEMKNGASITADLLVIVGRKRE